MSTPPDARGNPFSMRAALLLVVGGAAIFMALLWMIGAGLSGGPANDGGNHAGGKGLNGFAAFFELLGRSGYETRKTRSDTDFAQTGLLVLTPPHHTDASALNRILVDRRKRGPTLLILPKWQAMPIPAAVRPDDARQGWVLLGRARKPQWAEGLSVTGPLGARTAAGAPRWSGMTMAGILPDRSAVQTLSSGRIAALVRDTQGQTLAGLLDTGTDHGSLSQAAGSRSPRIKGSASYPLVIVAEPDLLNNLGFARQESAQLAVAMIAAMTDGQRMPIVFDLTLNGHVRTSNLLTLAFTPPFLAATLCLLLAALAIGWRAFMRFGPPATRGRAIAFGKAELVANTAGLIRGARRLHLLTVPYADQARASVASALGINRQPGGAATEAAIDRALESTAPGSEPFSAIARRLRGAKGPQQAVRAARDLHALERKLTHE